MYETIWNHVSRDQSATEGKRKRYVYLLNYDHGPKCHLSPSKYVNLVIPFFPWPCSANVSVRSIRSFHFQTILAIQRGDENCHDPLDESFDANEITLGFLVVSILKRKCSFPHYHPIMRTIILAEKVQTIEI